MKLFAAAMVLTLGSLGAVRLAAAPCGNPISGSWQAWVHHVVSGNCARDRTEDECQMEGGSTAGYYCNVSGPAFHHIEVNGPWGTAHPAGGSCPWPGLPWATSNNEDLLTQGATCTYYYP